MLRTCFTIKVKNVARCSVPTVNMIKLRACMHPSGRHVSESRIAVGNRRDGMPQSSERDSHNVRVA